MPTYRVDPADGNDANDGSSWAQAFKTIKKTFAAGDEILVAKAVETPLAGTVTVNQGSVTIDTTEDLTGSLAQYSVIRINNDPTVYMVRSITSSAITLNRPYRGTSGSGYGINVLTVPVVASGDFTPVAGNGTIDSHITLTGGVNPANDVQDGFTIVNVNNGSYGFSPTAARSWWDISRLGFYYCTYPWCYTQIHLNMTFTDCFTFRSGATGTAGIYNSVFTRPIYEVAGVHGLRYKDVVFNDPEISDYSFGCYLSRDCQNVVINNLRQSRGGNSGLAVDQNMNNVRFVNPIVNELNENVVAMRLTAAGANYHGLVIDNLKRGSGGASLINLAYPFHGEIAFTNIEGVVGSDQVYLGNNDASGNMCYLLERDDTVYHTAAPASRITAVGTLIISKSFFHYIPCEAGVEKTISVWFRKSSDPAYGSVNRPTMRLRWHTGTSPNIVPNVYDVVMPDTDDEFVQVSHTITPSIAEAVAVELIFLPGADGAMAWYDDIGVA